MTKSPKKNRDDWNDPRSEIIITSESNEPLAISGTFYHRNAEFKFSGRQQSSGNYIFRGRVSPVSPVDGKIMQLRGAKKTAKLKELEGRGVSVKNGTRQQDLNITREYHANSLEIEEIKSAIANKALKIYAAFADQIYDMQGESARPETITPAVAKAKHINEYFRVYHPKIQSKTVTEYRRNLDNACEKLPHLPMASFKPSDITKLLPTLTNLEAKLLREFWEYCIARKIVDGSFPFPATIKTKKKDAASKQEDMNKVHSLELEQEDKIYDLLYGSHSGEDCGVALML